MESQEIQKFEQEGVALIDQAKAIKIVDQQTREEAAAWRADVNQKIKQIDDYFEVPNPEIPGSGLQKKAHEAWKAACDLHKNLVANPKKALEITDEEIERDYLEQKRIHKEADEKSKAENAEKERKEKERLMKLAEKQLDRGDLDKAESTINRSEKVFFPNFNSAPPPQKTIRSSAGTTSAIDDVEVVVTAKRLFLQEVIAGKYPDLLVSIDLGALKKWFKANYGIKSLELPGIRSTVTARVSSRVA